MAEDRFKNEAEIVRRRDEALRRAMQAPPKPKNESKAKSKNKKKKD